MAQAHSEPRFSELYGGDREIRSAGEAKRQNGIRSVISSVVAHRRHVGHAEVQGDAALAAALRSSSFLTSDGTWKPSASWSIAFSRYDMQAADVLLVKPGRNAGQLVVVKSAIARDRRPLSADRVPVR